MIIKLSFIRLITFLYVSAFIAAAIYFVAPVQAAGSADIAFNFNKATYALNEKVELNIVIDTGSQAVIAGSLTIEYDSSRLQLLRIENNSSIFSGEVSATGGDGSINITKYATPIGTGATGVNLFSTAVFRALSSGNARVGVADSTLLFSDSGSDSVWNGQANEKSVTVLQSESNNIFTTTQDNSVPETVSRFASNPSQPAEEEQAEFPDRPIPIDTANITTEKSFVSIKVVDSEGDPVAGARVTLDGIITETDLLGIASFDNLSFGIYEVSITEPSGDTFSTNIEVLEASDPLEIQEFEFIVGDSSSEINPLYILLLIISGVILLTAGLLVYLHRKNTVYPQQPY